MNNLQKIEHHQTKCHFLFIFHLTCSKFFALKGNALTHSFQNYLSNHTITLIRVFIMGRSGCATKGGNWWDSLQAQKIELSPLLDIAPNKKLKFSVSPDLRPHIGKKKVSLIAFRQNFNKNFACSVHFQLHNDDLFEKIRWN